MMKYFIVTCNGGTMWLDKDDGQLYWSGRRLTLFESRREARNAINRAKTRDKQNFEYPAEKYRYAIEVGEIL